MEDEVEDAGGDVLGNGVDGGADDDDDDDNDDDDDDDEVVEGKVCCGPAWRPPGVRLGMCVVEGRGPGTEEEGADEEEGNEEEEEDASEVEVWLDVDPRVQFTLSGAGATRLTPSLGATPSLGTAVLAAVAAEPRFEATTEGRAEKGV